MRDNRDPKRIGKWLLRNRKPGPKSRLHRKADRLHEVEIPDYREKT